MYLPNYIICLDCLLSFCPPPVLKERKGGLWNGLRLSVRPSVCPFVRSSVRCSTASRFYVTLPKLYMPVKQPSTKNHFYSGAVSPIFNPVAHKTLVKLTHA